MLKLRIIIFVGFFLAILPISLSAQTIQILDKSSGLPVPDVAIFNQDMNKAVISDDMGNADIGIFSDSDSIYFQHPSYIRLASSKRELEALGNIIQLVRQNRMLEELVIAVKRWEQVKEEVPNKIKSISHEEMVLQNPQTAADLLTISNAVFLQKSQLGGGSPMVRGFSANSVLLVVDGVRMNNAIYRSGNLQNVISLDANIIQESEVIYGPGSVVYGSDALGGVMDFHTFDPQLSRDSKSVINVNASTRYSSANNEKMGHFHLNAGFKKWGFLTSVSYSDFDHLKMGGWDHPSYQRPEYANRIGNNDTILKNSNTNQQVYSGYNQVNLMQKFRFSPKNKINFTYAFHYSKTSNVPRYDRLIQYTNDQLKYAEWYYGPQKWIMNSITLQLDNKKTLYDNLKLILAYQNYGESRHNRKLYNSTLTHRNENVNIYSLNLDLNKKLGTKHSFFYGIESFFNDVKSTANSEDILTGEESPLSTRYPDGINHYFTISGYASIKLNLARQLTFDAGLRYNLVDLHSTIEDNSFYNFPFNEIRNTNSALNGSVGLVYRPGKETQINFNYSSGFRAPNLDDISKVFDSEPGGVVVPNEDLRPEYAYNFDFGWNQSFNKKVTFEINGFYTKLKDAMVRRYFKFNGQDSILYDNEMSQVFAMVNAREATIYGGSIDLVAKFTKAFLFKTDFTYLKGLDDEGFPLRHVPPYYGGVHLVYESKFFSGDFYFLYNGEISNENLAPEEQAKTYMYELDENGLPYSPSWYTLNFKLSIQPTNWMSIQGGIENILDVRYRPYSSGIVSPGRNFYVALKIAIG